MSLFKRRPPPEAKPKPPSRGILVLPPPPAGGRAQLNPLNASAPPATRGHQSLPLPAHPPTATSSNTQHDIPPPIPVAGPPVSTLSASAVPTTATLPSPRNMAIPAPLAPIDNTPSAHHTTSALPPASTPLPVPLPQPEEPVHEVITTQSTTTDATQPTSFNIEPIDAPLPIPLEHEGTPMPMTDPLTRLKRLSMEVAPIDSSAQTKRLSLEVASTPSTPSTPSTLTGGLFNLFSRASESATSAASGVIGGAGNIATGIGGAVMPGLRDSNALPGNTKVFGVALKPDATHPPALLSICEKYFDDHEAYKVQGLFRLSGSHLDIMALKDKIDKGLLPNLDDILDVHVVAGLFKLFFRELPVPLLTYDLYDCFIAAADIEDQEGRVRTIMNVLSMLPQGNLQAIGCLMSVLRKTVNQSEINKMTPQNLAIVFAPSLLRPDPSLSSHMSEEGGMLLQMKDSPYASSLLELFISQLDTIFGPELLAMIEERDISARASARRFITKADGRIAPEIPERRTRRKLDAKSSFAYYLLTNCNRLMFRSTTTGDYLAYDDKEKDKEELYAEFQYTNPLTCWVSKKELFEPQWIDLDAMSLVLIACDAKSRSFLVGPIGGDMHVGVRDRVSSNEHLWTVEIVEDDFLSFRHQLTGLFLGLNQERKLVLVEQSAREMFQLNIKVSITTVYKHILTSTALWTRPWGGGAMQGTNEMFVIQVEKANRLCSINHFNLMRGKRYLTPDGKAWDLVSKSVDSENELWIITSVERDGMPASSTSPVGHREISVTIQTSKTKQYVRSLPKGKIELLPIDTPMDGSTFFRLVPYNQ